MFIFKMSCASGTEQDQWPDCHGLPEATCGGWYVITSGAELTLNCTAPGWLGDGILKLLRLHFQTPNCFVFSEHACDLILASYAIAMHGCSKPFLGIAHGGFGTASPKCLISHSNFCEPISRDIDNLVLKSFPGWKLRNTSKYLFLFWHAYAKSIWKHDMIGINLESFRSSYIL